MPTITVTTPFRFAVDGNRIITVPTGEQEVSDRCALVAIEHLKVAKFATAKAEPRQRSKG